MRESDIERRLVQGVKKLGGRAYKFVSPGNVGVPDRLVVLPGGVVLFVEVKAPDGRLSPQPAAANAGADPDGGARFCSVGRRGRRRVFTSLPRQVHEVRDAE